MSEPPTRGERNGECYPECQMFRAVYRQIAKFLNWVNRTRSGSSASRTAREIERHRRDVESRYGGGGGADWGP